MAARNLTRTALQAAFIMIVAAGIGLATDSLRPDGLPLIRKPLRETRAVITKEQLVSNPRDVTAKPVATPSPKPTIPRNQKPSAKTPHSQPDPAPEKQVSPEPASVAPAGKSAPIAPKALEQKPSTPPKKVEALFTTLEDAKSLFDEGKAIFIDGRPEVDYEFEHIKGALSLYCEEFDKLYEQVLGKIGKDKIIITYCSDPECTEAVKLGDALVATGYTRVVILLEGLPGWKDSGWPVSTGKEPGQ